MKKTYRMLSALLLVIPVYMILNATKTEKVSERATLQSGSAVTITPALLNGKPTFFKTYHDFVNGTGQAWVYDGYDVGHTFGPTPHYLVAFKNENGKRVKVSASDFWGWRDKDGSLWRNGEFHFEKITHIPFMVNYIANNHIMYSPGPFPGATVQPSEWCSENLNDPIIQIETYFKMSQHSKAPYTRIAAAKDKCNSQPAPKKEKWADHNKRILSCYSKAPDLICIWSNDLQSGHGAYMFNENPVQISRDVVPEKSH